MKLSAIKVNPNNPRLIRDEKFERLKKSVESFPQMMELRPIVIDADGVILGGNMRFQALKALGRKEIPDAWVKRADELTEDEKREFIIKDNAGFGDWDWDLIANEWDDLPLTEWGLDVPEFADVEDEGTADAEPQIDRAAELNEKWQVKTGDLWQIGGHRLLCGDSTKREDVERLMAGGKAEIVFADPPYGVSIVSGSKPFGSIGGDNIIQAGTYAPIIGDETTETAEMSYRLAASLFADAVHIWWGGNYYANILPPSPAWLVWDKDNTGNFGDGELAWTNQPTAIRIFKHTWNGLIKESERGEKRVHPTQKPVALAKWCFTKYADEKRIVFDPFLGSGMSMVAAENVNKKARGIEMSPDYCAVILERMQTAFPDIEITRIEQADGANG